MAEAKKDTVENAIQEVIKTMMDRVMHRVLVEDPFLSDSHKADKPLYAALVPDEIFKGSHFERRFVTPFGGVWEKLAVVLAKEILGHAQTAYVVRGTVAEGRLRRIAEVLNNLEHTEKGKIKVAPDWQKELDYILKGKGKAIPVMVLCDVYAEDVKRNKKYAFELKAPLPNSDQSKVSKEKIFKLYAMEPRIIDDAYYALPYNPYGKRADYSWSFPARWFDMRNDPVVLIGDEFWDKLGGKGAYQKFIDEVNKLGKDYRLRIYKEYLRIDPPVDFDRDVL